MLEIVNYNKEEYNFPALVVLGCFDAVHVGHAELLKKAKLQAKINGLDLGIMMFAEGKGGRQVFTFEERLAFLAGYNTKFVLKIDYTDEFKKTTAADFLHNLEEHINVKAYMSGKDFRFGAGAKGKSSTLKNYAEDEENGVWYMPVKDVMVDGEKVSTTLIKKYIEEGKIQKANALLGRQYFVTGEVCEGHGRGKTLGFPTANIVYPANKVLVKDGVYGVEAEIDGTVYRGVANCGPRPTFGEDAVVLEAYFEGLSEELYGKPVTIKFVNYIRGIKKFDSAEALSQQISRDIACIGAPDADTEAEEAAPVTEVPADAPAETVAETPAEAAEEKPAAEPVETVVETPAATEPETATEVPAETAATVPAEEPAETEPEVAADAPVETVTEEPVPAMEEVPAEAPVEAAEEPAAEPEVAAEEPIAEEPAAACEEAPSEEVKAEEVQPEPEQPAEETTVGEVTESDVSDPEGEIAVAAEPAEEEAVTKLVEEVFEEEEPEQPSDAEQPEVPAEVAESEEEPAETVEEEPSTEPEAATEEQAAEPVTEEQAAEEVSEEIAVSEDAEEVPAEPVEEEPAETVEEQSEAPAEEVTESAEEPVEQPVCEPAEEPVTAPAAEEPACEPEDEESEEPAEESAEEETDEAETTEEEQEQEADQPAEQTSRKSKKRKRSRGKADRRRGDTRKR